MRRRAAFTLLEVLLAMTIAVLVLGAVYAFVGNQLRQASAGRDVIERSTLARSIIGRIDTDLRSVIALNDPGRYRLQPDDSGDNASSSTGSTSTTGTTGTSGSSTTGSSTTSSSTGSSTTSGSTSTTATTPGSSGLTNSGTDGISTTTGLIDLPRGVMGTSTQLNIFVSRVPSEAYPSADSNSNDSPPPGE